MIYFIVSGSARSGTSVLQQVINTNRNVACFHEYDLNDFAQNVENLFEAERRRDLMHEGLKVVPKINDTIKNFNSSSLINETSSFQKSINDPTPIPLRSQHFAKIINSLFSAVFDKYGLKAAGDKMPNITSRAYLGKLNAFYPGIRIILIIRHPADVIKSSLARAEASKNDLDVWHIENFEEALDEWIKNWEFAARIVNLSEYQHAVVKYERLKTHFDEEMQRIANLLEIPNEFINIIDSNKGTGDKYKLSAEQEYCLLERVGVLAESWQNKTIETLLAENHILPYVIDSGQFISAIGEGNLSHVLREGFGPLEEWGSWTVGTHARIVLRLRSARPIENIWIDIAFIGYTGGMSDFVFGITVNSNNIEMTSINSNGETIISSNFGKLFKIENGLVEIRFSIPRPKRPGQIPIDDNRSIGFGIKSIRATIL